MNNIEQIILLITALNPALILMFAGLFLYRLPNLFYKLLVLILPIFCAFITIFISNKKLIYYNHFIFQLQPYSQIVISAFLIVLFLSSIFAFGNKKSKNEVSAAFFHAGCAIGVVLAGDLITLFCMIELMTLSSLVILFQRKTQGAYSASIRYALIHLLSGILLLIGITMQYHLTQSFAIPTFVINTNINYLNTSNFPALLILISLLINTGVPPFSAWVADTYPEASTTGAVFLSSYTTKAAEFCILTIFAGSQVLIYLGLFMIFYSIIYAILENDIRRQLSYTIVNQAGFMIAAIGIGTKTALSGAALLLFCHILYMNLLFMTSGSVMFMTGKRKFSDLGGLYKSMKLTTFCALIGAISISAFPFTSGFISKSVIMDSATDIYIWILLVIASACVFLHAGMKFPWFIFFHKDSGLRPKDPPLYMQLAMILTAFLCILPGLKPDILYNLLPININYNPYISDNVFGQLQLLIFSGFAFFIMLPVLKRTNNIIIDFDWFYRVALHKLFLIVMLLFEFIGNALTNVAKLLYQGMLYLLEHYFGNSGTFSAQQTISTTLVFSLTCLLAILLFSMI